MDGGVLVATQHNVLFIAQDKEKRIPSPFYGSGCFDITFLVSSHPVT